MCNIAYFKLHLKTVMDIPNCSAYIIKEDAAYTHTYLRCEYDNTVHCKDKTITL